MARKKVTRTYQVVAVPERILRLLNYGTMSRDDVSEEDLEKLATIRNVVELARTILDFLLNDPNRGFTATEISEAVESVSRNKVRLLLAGLGVEHRHRGRTLFSIYPPTVMSEPQSRQRSRISTSRRRREAVEKIEGRPLRSILVDRPSGSDS